MLETKSDVFFLPEDPNADEVDKLTERIRNCLPDLITQKLSDFCPHIVGGAIRDILLGHKPKDYDLIFESRDNLEECLAYMMKLPDSHPIGTNAFGGKKVQCMGEGFDLWVDHPETLLDKIHFTSSAVIFPHSVMMPIRTHRLFWRDIKNRYVRILNHATKDTILAAKAIELLMNRGFTIDPAIYVIIHSIILREHERNKTNGFQKRWSSFEEGFPQERQDQEILVRRNPGPGS